MKNRTCFTPRGRGMLTVASLLAAATLTAGVSAQTNPLVSDDLAVSVKSGQVSATGEADGRQVVFSHLVTADNAPWVRLYFGEVVLSGDIARGTNSILRLTSMEDGGDQFLNAITLEQWRNSSAYFNGGAVLVELLAYPGTGPSMVEIDHVTAGIDGDIGGGIASQCGPTDDRFLDQDPTAARVLPIGCTGWLISDGTDNCALTAGHCLGGADVFEFNVPLSDPNGNINMADPDDQYPVDPTSVQGISGGVGNDWGYLGCFDNANTGLAPRIAQGASVNLPGSQPPVDNGQLRITGYGVDNGESNQVSQTDFGTYDDLQGTWICYNDLDTQGGNSGSAVMHNGFGIGIHTHGGCSNDCNKGTRIDNAGLQAALANPQGICAGEDPGACCFPDLTCADNVTPADCFNSGGSFQGAGTICNKIECVLDGCGAPDAGDCFVPNGTPYCNDFDCCELICAQDPFCCDTEWDGICADAAVAQCNQGEITGACCFSDGTCANVTGDECESAGGAYQGDNTNCANVDCTPDEKCQGDFDGDGQVGVLDLLFLLGVWGPCDTGGDCESNVCGTYTFDCDPSGLCICVPLSNGGTMCLDGSTSCGDPCPNGDADCPPGMICVLDTCCGPTTCVPADAECAGGGGANDCEVPWECVGQIEICEDTIPCYCFKATDGSGVCGPDFFCDNPPCPNGDSDCPPGMICFVDSCCGAPICGPVCFEEAGSQQIRPQYGDHTALGVYGVDYIYKDGVAYNLREVAPVKTLTGVYGVDYVHEGGVRIDLSTGFDTAEADDNPDCPGDLDGDGMVGVLDLLKLLGVWGPCDGGGGDCDAPFECGGSIVFCEDGVCICFQGDGGPACLQDTSCTSTACPNGDADCPPGMGCIVASCCAGPVCAPMCESGAQQEPEFGEQRALGVYGVDFIIENGQYVLID